MNACYLDLDSYELTPGQALGRLTQAAGEGIIPSPSVFGLSGRGIWAYWILVDVRDSLIPQRAFPEKIDLYSHVQRGLYEAVMEFEPRLRPDANALDPARVTRVPGSVNTKSGQRVHHFASLDAVGSVSTYDLAQLHGFLGLAEAQQHPRASSKYPRRCL